MTKWVMRSRNGCDRRQFVKRSAAAAGAAAVFGAVPLRYPLGSQEELRWLTYPGHAAEEVIGPFEEKHGVRIRAQEYSAGERLLALIHGSPPGSFDVVMSDSPYVEWLRRGGFLQPMDPAEYPLDDFWPEFQNWRTHWHEDTLYAVATSWGYNGLAYNSEVLTEQDVESYAIMWDERLQDRLGMRDWYLPVMGCISAYMGHEEPFNISNEQFQALREEMFSLAPSVVGFWGFAGVFDSLADGRAYVIPGCGDWITGLLQRDGHPIRSMAPKEGAISWVESNSIVEGTTKPDLAREFIRYLASPEGQVRLATKSSYMASSPSVPAWELLNEENPEEARMLHMDLDDYNLIDMFRDGRIHIRQLPQQQSIEDWQDAYTEFQNL